MPTLARKVRSHHEQLLPIHLTRRQFVNVSSIATVRARPTTGAEPHWNNTYENTDNIIGSGPHRCDGVARARHELR
jgi:hypothetical protein